MFWLMDYCLEKVLLTPSEMAKNIMVIDRIQIKLAGVKIDSGCNRKFLNKSCCPILSYIAAKKCLRKDQYIIA